VRYRQAIRTTRRTGQSRPSSRAPNAPGSMNAAARMPEPRLSRINESIMPRGCPKACGCGHYAKRAVFEAAQGRLFRSLPCGQRRSAAGCRADCRAACPFVPAPLAAKLAAITLDSNHPFRSRLVREAQSSIRAPSIESAVDFVCFVQDKLLFEEDTGCPGALSPLLRWL
jgi:hypothetical protein